MLWLRCSRLGVGEGRFLSYLMTCFTHPLRRLSCFLPSILSRYHLNKRNRLNLKRKTQLFQAKSSETVHFEASNSENFEISKSYKVTDPVEVAPSTPTVEQIANTENPRRNWPRLYRFRFRALSNSFGSAFQISTLRSSSDFQSASNSALSASVDSRQYANSLFLQRA